MPSDEMTKRLEMYGLPRCQPLSYCQSIKIIGRIAHHAHTNAAFSGETIGSFPFSARGGMASCGAAPVSEPLASRGLAVLGVPRGTGLGGWYCFSGCAKKKTAGAGSNFTLLALRRESRFG